MILLNPYVYANRNGILRLEANSVNVGTTNVTFTFTPHNFLNKAYSELILFKLPGFTAPSTAVPIVFSTNGKNQDLTTLGGEAVTSATLNKAGIYLYGNTGMYNPEMILDITADVNGTMTNFQKLPANSEIADFGNNIVISCNKEAMSSEINSMKQRSTDIVNSIQLHKDIIKGCDEILIQLNPEIQERQRQEAENKALGEEVNSLKEMFKEFMKSWQQ